MHRVRHPCDRVTRLRHRLDVSREMVSDLDAQQAQTIEMGPKSGPEFTAYLNRTIPRDQGDSPWLFVGIHSWRCWNDEWKME